MKKILGIGLSVIIVGLLGFYFQTTQLVYSNPSTVEVVKSTSGTSTAAWVSSSAGVASSTLQFASENSTALAVSVWSSASSTSAVFNFAFQYSDNGTDWYSAETASTTNATGGKYVLSQGTGIVPWAWTPGSATTSRTWLMPDQPPAKYGRLVYWATGADGYFFVEVSQKKEY